MGQCTVELAFDQKHTLNFEVQCLNTGKLKWVTRWCIFIYITFIAELMLPPDNIEMVSYAYEPTSALYTSGLYKTAPFINWASEVNAILN